MSPYPTGTGPSDPNAPWNKTEPEECVECAGVWAENGHKPISNTIYTCTCSYEWRIDTEDAEPSNCPECGSEDITPLPCPNEGQTMKDLKEAERAANAEMKMDEIRIESGL